MYLKNLLLLSSLFLLFIGVNSCTNNQETENNMKDSLKLTINEYPERVKNAVIYEVNIRQYTPEGTISAFVEHIPRLKELGIDILWLMPIQPIGEKNRKGELGSYYSIKNYTAVNPEFGTEQDFRNLVKIAHENEMLVLLDWVANHSAWDNDWVNSNEDWYTHDAEGNIIPPVEDWADVADLNYDNQEMRNEMVNSMKFWLENFDIDGFRCDMAMMVPTDFWDFARVELDKIKPVFMLSEAEETDLMINAFDANYSWELLHLTEDIAQGKKKAVDLIDYFLYETTKFPPKDIRMVFTSNHDENSWSGSVFERYPNCHKTFALFSFVVPSMPLIYSGQEACLDKRIEFFTKDTIEWKDCEMTDFYKKLISLKKENQALWNGEFGSGLEFVATETNEDISTFVREKDDNKILCIFNMSDKTTSVKYTDQYAEGTYKEYFTGKEINISINETYTLQPWEYWILIKQ